MLLAYMRQVGDPEKETNCIQNIGLPGSVETCDGIESLVKAINFRPLTIGLEAVDDH